MTAHLTLEAVGKRYRRSGRRDALRDLLPALAGQALGLRRDDADEFWALRDLSLRVSAGEAVGIIGPNGSGKSTALKILAGIVHPTTGRRIVAGRLGAMLELGAAFHPDLTGRDNVFLQGSLLGLSRADVRARFDAIVDFSGIAAFLDTPLKYYSSGMHARLGFSVAAHLEPEALVIDEVLSVGDWGFQQRAYARMRQLVASGLPCVLVTHQLDRVLDLCTRAILLRDGAVAYAGTPSDTVEAYLRTEPSPMSPDDADAPARFGPLTVTPSVTAAGAEVSLTLPMEVLRTFGEAWHLQLVVRSLQSGQAVYAGFGEAFGLGDLPLGSRILRGRLAAHLADGLYQLEVGQVEAATGGVATGTAVAVFRVHGHPTVHGPAALHASLVTDDA